MATKELIESWDVFAFSDAISQQDSGQKLNCSLPAAVEDAVDWIEVIERRYAHAGCNVG